MPRLAHLLSARTSLYRTYHAPVHSLFLKKLKSSLKIPVLALVDSDPYGLKILSVYMKASQRPSGRRGL